MLKTFEYVKYPIVEIVNEIILDCVRRGASDIHFDPTEGPIRVRIRIDGSLADYAEVPKEFSKNLITRIKIFAGMNITESRLPQDGAIKTELNNTAIDLRVSALPTNQGEKVVIRILDYTMSSQGLEALDFSQKNFDKMIYSINQPNGIILVTGATGSGKSTTVYSVLQRLNTEDRNIISVEDPVEMNLEGVNQVQTNSDIGLDFANVLRSILRQDPNVIMIGEIRDTETAKIAVRASITGHLVLSTLHTNDALSTIERLLDMEVERYLLSSALLALISQKLAKRLCQSCKVLKPVNEYEHNLMRLVLNENVDSLYVPGDGCDECSNGYKGRIAIHEVLVINQEVRDAIANRIDKDKLRHLVYNSDVTTMLRDGLEKVFQGLTSVEEIIKLIELDDDSETSETTHKLQQAIFDSKISGDKSKILDSINLDVNSQTTGSTPKPIEIKPKQAVTPRSKKVQAISLNTDLLDPTVATGSTQVIIESEEVAAPPVPTPVAEEVVTPAVTTPIVEQPVKPLVEEPIVEQHPAELKPISPIEPVDIKPLVEQPAPAAQHVAPAPMPLTPGLNTTQPLLDPTPVSSETEHKFDINDDIELL